MKEVEETDLNKEYYLIQKNIGSNWEERGRYQSKEEALEEVNKLITNDANKNNIFIYRLIKIEEIKLYKSKEKKPDDIADIF